MNRSLRPQVFILISCFLAINMIQAQKVPVKTDTSMMAGIRFPAEALSDKRLISIATAKQPNIRQGMSLC
jgi:hypothetical protein